MGFLSFEKFGIVSEKSDYAFFLFAGKLTAPKLV